jgi:aryl-alcohol dehydrogenase-like predicted oxidoreductase
MQYKLLGRTGVKVSSLCFGAMTFGNEADESISAAIYRRCRETGINFFDCANTYAGGRSEEILGRLIKGEREQLVITTKVYGRVGTDVNDGGLSRRHVTRQVEASLKRLGTDRIDLYFCHMFDVQTPIEETLGVMDDLVKQGKILYPAVSNWSAWQIMKAQGIAERKAQARFECMQPMYNLAKRQAEVELLPMAQAEQIGVIPYNPLGGGLLTGKYSRQAKPVTGRLVENKAYGVRYGDEAYYDVVERFVAHARERGVSPVSLAVAWVMSHPAITAPIIGARSVEQLEGSLAALNIKMTPAWRAEISALSPTPPLATDRSEEQKV